MSAAAALRDLRERGFFLLPSALSSDLVHDTAAAVDAAARKYEEVHRRTGYTGADEGGQHHVLAEGGAFLRVLDALEPMDVIGAYLRGRVIVNSFGSLSNVRGRTVYVHRMHRDVRFFVAERPMMMNVLVMLDAFTLANGATALLPGSHLRDVRPTDEEFRRGSVRVEGPRGSILIFDSALWHAAAENTTEVPRRALTLTLTNPFFKPQFDYCRALGDAACEGQSEKVRQLLGWYARVPASLEEWYRPKGQRFYRSDQDES